jgi:uncharacterized protein YPO0396
LARVNWKLSNNVCSIMSALEFNFGDASARPGWRLHRLEMLNWGTFGGSRVHIMEPAGGWSLLVGENGSGKSTAIDALRTLLVPRQVLRGSFNDAAGGQGKRDRTLVSYIRGQWSASREEDADSSAPAFLRSEDTLTVLLAVFSHEQRGARLTLAQLLSVTNGKDHCSYLVAPEEKSIAADLQGLSSGREQARQLKERRFAAYDSFPGYFRDFGQRMGVPEQSAMEIFNQAIGIKEVVSVNDFLRRHLLARGDAPERIRNKIIPSFANLEECWASIQRDKAQIALLAPIVEAHQKVEEAQAKKAVLERLVNLLPRHYAMRHVALLEEAQGRLSVAVEDHEGAVVSLDERISVESSRRDEIKDALARDESTQRIKAIELEIREIDMTIAGRRKAHGDCERVAARFSLGSFHDDASFLTLKTRAAEHREGIVHQKEEAEQQSHAAAVAAKEVEPQIARQARELQALKERRVLIPHDFQNVRDMVCEQTGLTAEELPFAGELVEVKPEREDWTGAIERLMHTFGVSMLVPEHCYQKVAPLVNKRRLLDASGRKGLRFHFHRVSSASPTHAKGGQEDDTVAECLNYRREHALSRWVESEVQRSFRHVCCPDALALEQHSHGITREGLVRSGTRHVKDDRQMIDDRTQYVLGWSPQRKIDALEESIVRLKRDLADARDKELQARSRAKALGDEALLLTGLLGVASFADVDFSQAAAELERLRDEKARLESRSDARLELTRQLEQAEKTLKELQEQRDTRRDALRTARTERDGCLSKLAIIRTGLVALPADGMDLTEDDLAEVTGLESGAEISTATIEAVEQKVVRSLEGKASQQQRLINQGREAMGSPMRKFLEVYPEEDKDLRAHPDYSSDFVRIHQRLVSEDLPSHEERFREFLNDNLIQYVGGLDAALTAEVKVHHRRLDQVNTALAKLEYSHATHVQIHHPDSRDVTIREFRGQLRDILGTGMHVEEEHQRLALFEKMQKLVSRFRADADWTRKVADSREWIDFGIRELRNEDGSQLDYFDSSQGKSGGQKAKLAFTVLAAALHAQYGLAENAERTDTFRLVIIDEIFARTDEPNSRRALQLFQSMGFQLLLAAPWEAKVRIAEPFVDSYHLAVNPKHNASSVLRATREAYDKAREHAVDSKKPNGQPQ